MDGSLGPCLPRQTRCCDLALARSLLLAHVPGGRGERLATQEANWHRSRGDAVADSFGPDWHTLRLGSIGRPPSSVLLRRSEKGDVSTAQHVVSLVDPLVHPSSSSHICGYLQFSANERQFTRRVVPRVQGCNVGSQSTAVCGGISEERVEECSRSARRVTRRRRPKYARRLPLRRTGRRTKVASNNTRHLLQRTW